MGLGESTAEGRTAGVISAAQCAGVEDELSAFLAESGLSGSAGGLKLDILFRIALKVMGIDMHLERKQGMDKHTYNETHTYNSHVH